MMKSKKNKRTKRTLSNKVYVHSSYKLSEGEIQNLKKLLPNSAEKQWENIIDKDIFAGVVLQSGTKLIDLSLSKGLQNLKQFIYENS